MLFNNQYLVGVENRLKKVEIHFRNGKFGYLVNDLSLYTVGIYCDYVLNFDLVKTFDILLSFQPHSAFSLSHVSSGYLRI